MIRKIAIHLLILTVVGGGLITIAHADTSAGTIIPCTDDCHFNDFIILIKNIVNFMILASIPISVVAFVWVGILLLTAQGNTAKIEQAKGIANKVGIGFLFILGGWLIVNSVASVLLKPQFNPFLIQPK